MTYITTPIYYVNGDPHVGHAYTTIIGDILKRCAQLRGKKVFYTTGVDEHGQKSQKSIEQSGLSATQYLHSQSEKFRQLFQHLNVSHDYFVRTSNRKHKSAVENILKGLFQRGLLIKKQYNGLYCEGCEQFKTISDLDDRGFCIDHQLPPEQFSETNYFLELEIHRHWLIAYVHDHIDWIQPLQSRNEVLNLLKKPLDDFCISRPKKRVTLGIELPFDKNYVTYVWFEALLNYITSIGYPDNISNFQKWWHSSIHLLGKDILKTHCIYWPILLRIIGIDPPEGIQVHSYWLGEGGLKMSKSLGNTIDPREIIEIFGSDVFRFYLAKNTSKSDSQISLRLIQECYQKDLANNLGNLHLRVVKLTKKFFNDQKPICKKLHSEDQTLINEVAARAQKVFPKNNLISEISILAKTIISLGSLVNIHFNQAAPWSLPKTPEGQKRLASVLYSSLDALRIIWELAYPILPNISQKALRSIGEKVLSHKTQKHDFHPLRLRIGDNAALEKAVILFPKIND
jgi:methionyl-tRNA synthetase